jgi:alpha-D-ribose 1-methylphosphonate 5-triphosphate synthase subunit PhnG
MGGPGFPETDRKAWLGVLAKAPHGRLVELAAPARAAAAFEWLRPAEIGAVMVRGRIGGTGAPFNLGEMTVTRASLRLASGEVGHGYVQGRSKPAAEAAALIDALMQTAAAARLRDAVVRPLAAEAEAAARDRAAKAAATKVEFFTLVRGED